MSPESMRICVEGGNFGAKTSSKWYLRGEMRIHLFIESPEKDIRIMSGTDSIQRIKGRESGVFRVVLESQAYLS